MSFTATHVGAGPRTITGGYICRRCGRHILTHPGRGYRYCVDCKHVMRDLGEVA